MAPDIKEIERSIEKTLGLLSEQGESDVVSRIKPVLHKNLAKGRIHAFIDGDVRRVSEYVRKVVETYKRLAPMLDQLQGEHASSEAWDSVFPKMQTWAYNFFIRKNFYPGANTQEIASECATEAALTLLEAQFPYDTGFDAWAHTIVLNVCRRYIRGGMLAGKYQENAAVLDDLDNVEDPLLRDFEHRRGLESELVDALGKLPDHRRRVVEFLYFEELSPVEIAARLNTTIGAVYSLHFNALVDLKRIMSQAENNLYE